MSVRAVLLDVGGVFLVPDPVVIGEALGVRTSSAAVTRGHYAGVGAMDATGDPDWTPYYRAMAGCCGAPASWPALVDVFSSAEPWRVVLPGSVDALRRLAADGYALGIVSNADGTIAERLLRAKVCQVGAGEGVPVTVVVDSGAIGLTKPDPAIFAAALAELGVEPADAVHVGDTVTADIDGARAAGVRPVHVDPYADCPCPHLHEHVRSVADLPGLLAAE